jgi:hypothetical protein
VTQRELAYLRHDGVLRETDKAKLFRIHGNAIWIPKRRTVLVDEDPAIVCIAKWWADRRGLESDW